MQAPQSEHLTTLPIQPVGIKTIIRDITSLHKNNQQEILVQQCVSKQIERESYQKQPEVCLQINSDSFVLQ